ncbi:LuxR C-terminal-related transcriptional regulator [Vitreimonas flagellata]|uniref:LuxR C-terminal-related transcriptional regulator n=1 Tax=Vitreimonas flagellata TaxID=2560861 RepID=UPI0010751A48|nr:LuxR C-terminal-related transcriptional regulator [Vitreimonas flagellata]
MSEVQDFAESSAAALLLPRATHGDATPLSKLEPKLWTQRDRVTRVRLLDRLQGARHKRLISLVGPAGSGKSILLAQHFQASRAQSEPIAWLTLDHADTDPRLLLNGLVRALEAALGPAPDDVRHDAVEAAANEPALAVRRLLDWPKLANADACVIVDGYEIVAGAPSAALIDAWVRVSATRLIVASRVAPDAPLALTRAQGDVESITARDLALDTDELMALAGEQVSPIYIDRLMRETGGAPVVACHALGALREPMLERPPVYLRSWRGMLQDYYREQLRHDLSPALWNALVRLAAVEFFNIPLASDIVGAPAGEFVAELYRERGLVIRHGAGGIYHVDPGLRAALAPELEWIEEDELRRLHSRAAAWFAKRGHAPYAALHAIAANDHSLAAACMSKAGSAAFSARVGVRELRLSLSSLSDIDTHEPIITQARALTLAQEAPSRYSDLVKAEVVDPRTDPEMTLINAFIDAYADIAPLPELVEVCRDLAMTDNVSDLAPRGLARCYLCWEALRDGRLQDALQWAMLSRDDLDFADAAYAGVFVHLHAAHILFYLDDIERARLHMNEAEQATKLFFPDDPRLMNLVWVWAAWIESEQGAELRAEDVAASFEATCSGEGWADALWMCTVLASRQAMRRGDLVGAARALDRGLGEASARGATRLLWSLRSERVRLLTAMGDLDAATSDARRLDLFDLQRAPLGAEPLTWREVTEGWVNAARLALAQGDLARASALAERLQAFAAEREIPRLSKLAARFLDMIATGEIDPMPDCADDCDECEQQPVCETGAVAAARQGSPLTPREQELMNLVAKGLVNKQIAYELGVTETTIKFHMRNIYKKLRARNRVQALMRLGGSD